MPTHPKGKKPFALKRTKPFTKSQLMEQARKANVTLSAASSDERVLANTPVLRNLYAFLDKGKPDK